MFFCFVSGYLYYQWPLLRYSWAWLSHAFPKISGLKQTFCLEKSLPCHSPSLLTLYTDTTNIDETGSIILKQSSSLTQLCGLHLFDCFFTYHLELEDTNPILCCWVWRDFRFFWLLWRYKYIRCFFGPPLSPPGPICLLMTRATRKTRSPGLDDVTSAVCRKSHNAAYTTSLVHQPHSKCSLRRKLGGGNSKIFYFHPYLGKWSNLTI